MIRFPDPPNDFTDAQVRFIRELFQTLQSQFADAGTIPTFPFARLSTTKPKGKVQQLFVPDDPDGPAIYVSTPDGWRRTILVV